MVLDEIFINNITMEQKKDLLLLWEEGRVQYCYDVHNTNYNILCCDTSCDECPLSEQNREETIELWKKEIANNKKRTPKKKDKGWKKTLKEIRGYSEGRNKLRHISK